MRGTLFYLGTERRYVTSILFTTDGEPRSSTGGHSRKRGTVERVAEASYGDFALFSST